MGLGLWPMATDFAIVTVVTVFIAMSAVVSSKVDRGTDPIHAILRQAMVTILQHCLHHIVATAEPSHFATKISHRPKRAIAAAAAGSVTAISSTVATRFTTFTGLAAVIGDCRQRNSLASVEADLRHQL